MRGTLAKTCLFLLGSRCARHVKGATATEPTHAFIHHIYDSSPPGVTPSASRTCGDRPTGICWCPISGKGTISIGALVFGACLRCRISPLRNNLRIHPVFVEAGVSPCYCSCWCSVMSMTSSIAVLPNQRLISNRPSQLREQEYNLLAPHWR